MGGGATPESYAEPKPSVPTLTRRPEAAYTGDMPWLEYLAVGIGGFVGAIARHGIGGFVQRQAGDGFPAGTITINLVGCFLIGTMAAIAETSEGLDERMRLVFMVGLLGSFTTFSTFGNDTFVLIRDGRFRIAIAYATLSVVGGLGAVILGRSTARFLGI